MIDIEDAAALLAWLREHGHIARDQRPRVEVLAGGVSNRTVLVEHVSGEAWVVKQALEKLRVAADWRSSPERIEREALAIGCLNELLPHGGVPALLFVDREQYLLTMSAVPRPHENWKAMLMSGRLDLDHVRQFGRLLATIHSESARKLAELPQLLRDRTFFDSLRLDPYYRYSAAQVAEAANFLDKLVGDTLEIQSALVHGDYSPKNILVHAGRLVLIDHEVAHIGDPAFDVGFGMTHLLSKAHHLVAHRAGFIEAAHLFWAEYARGGVAEESRAVRHTLGCLLARVAGKSRLEYLSQADREHQQRIVVKLMRQTPERVPALIDAFTGELHA